MPTFQPVTFINPANGSSYTWPNNPDLDAETKQGTTYGTKARQIEYTSNTGNIGLTRQQGDDGPFILFWQFNVYSQAFLTELYQWYALSKLQSIYLIDFNAEKYEGQITTLGRQRQGALNGPADVGQRGFFAQMEMAFDVWSFLTGPLATAGITG